MNTLLGLDWAGLAVWALAWGLFQGWSAWANRREPDLAALMTPLRWRWMQEAVRRENRVTDASLVGNLMQSATFFSSTTLLVVGGLFAFLGTVDKSAGVVEAIPLARHISAEALEFKILAVTFVLIYALVRFTWALRQFNLLNIVLGALPTQREVGIASGPEADLLVTRGARLNELAGQNFTQGLRAWYFSVPLLLWIVNPWLLVLGSVVIGLACWFMESRSATVVALRDGLPPAR